MGWLYLIRHGQAGTREDYDRLSELGREQARRLGVWLRGQAIDFDEVIRGGLVRQRETAELALGAGRAREDARWSEFDLDTVYAGIAPQLARLDREFGAHYQSLQARIAGGDRAVHRQWTPADVAVMRAWVRSEFTIDGESWPEFKLRVAAGFREAVAAAAGQRRVAVFSSATPIGIATAEVLKIAEPVLLELVGVLVNASVSLFRVSDGQAKLFQFNLFPHLDEERMQTFR